MNSLIDAIQILYFFLVLYCLNSPAFPPLLITSLAVLRHFVLVKLADVEDFDADIFEVGLALVEIFVLVAEVLLVADKFGSVSEAVSLG